MKWEKKEQYFLGMVHKYNVMSLVKCPECGVEFQALKMTKRLKCLLLLADKPEGEFSTREVYELIDETYKPASMDSTRYILNKLRKNTSYVKKRKVDGIASSLWGITEIGISYLEYKGLISSEMAEKCRKKIEKREKAINVLE